MQVHDTPNNFHRPSTSRITELTKEQDLPNSPQRERIRSGYVNDASRACAYSRTCQSTGNPPNSPKEIGSGPFVSITHLELVLIFPIKFLLDPTTLSIFQVFWFSRFPFQPSTPQRPRIRSELKKQLLRHDIFLYINFHYHLITNS